MAFSTSNLTQDQVNQIRAAGQNGVTNIGGIDYTEAGLTGGGQDGGFTAQQIDGYEPGTYNQTKAQRSQFGMDGTYTGMGANLDGGGLDGVGMLALALISGGTLMEMGAFGGIFEGAPTGAMSDPALAVQGNSINALDAGSAGVAANGGQAVTYGTELAESQGVQQAATAVQQAVQQGSTLEQAVQQTASKLGITPSALMSTLKAVAPALGDFGKQILGTAANVAGGVISSEAAKSAANKISTGAKDAANILSPAYTSAAKLQSDAQTNAANTMAGGYTGAASTEAAGFTGAGHTLSDAYKLAAQQESAGLDKAQVAADKTLTGQQAVQAPYSMAGTTALGTLSTGLQSGGQFNKPFSMADMGNVMPAYKFAEGQAMEAMNNQMAAGGQQLSSNAVAGAGKLASGLASQFEQQAFSQWMQQNNLTLGALQNMVSTGQMSANQLQQALSQHGMSSEQIQTAIGAVMGQGTLGAGKAQADAQISSAKALGAGQLGAAGANAQGQVGSANATAGGVMGSAGAQANATQQSANALAAGDVVSANAITTAMGNTANGLIGDAALRAANSLASPNVIQNNYTMGDAGNAYDNSVGFGTGSNFGNEDYGLSL